jgi:hypothetical protein
MTQKSELDAAKGCIRGVGICIVIWIIIIFALSCSKPEQEDCYACAQTIAGSQTTVIYFDVCDVSEQDITALERKVNCKCVKIK